MFTLYTLMLSVSTYMLYDQPMTAKAATQKPYHHGDLRQEILCAARELLEANNIASLSLRAVSKQVGVSHTAPYRHFKDKESLLAGIAGVGYDELAKQLTEAVEAHPDDPAAQLQEAGHRYVQLGLNSPQCTQLMFSGILPCDDTYPELRASGDMAFDGLKTIIEEGQTSGVFKKGDVELLALTAWSGIHGLSLLLIGGNLPEFLTMPTDTRPLTSAVTATMLEGLKAN
jgi:AcrR family transcriptional regulator